MAGGCRARQAANMRTDVLSQDEARSLLAHMEGRPQLLASLFYGTGMRLMERLRLRFKDGDFARNESTIRAGKGAKDRHTVLPKSLSEPLQRDIEGARMLHAADLAAGFGAASLPYAPARGKRARFTYSPRWVILPPSSPLAFTTPHPNP